ncbi:hypothetical protein [Dactylosporangium sp. CA-092794]|uniref:hypothetical protein n=1 Tax=Dactylosporangium sp. CA-092794 TaxID=3239929 RepID=UPI003D91F656
MHRVTLWIFSTLSLAVVGVLIGYQVHIGTKYLPPLSLIGGDGGTGAKPSMSQIAAICNQLPRNQPGGPGAPGGAVPGAPGGGMPGAPGGGMPGAPGGGMPGGAGGGMPDGAGAPGGAGG